MGGGEFGELGERRKGGGEDAEGVGGDDCGDEEVKWTKGGRRRRREGERTERVEILPVCDEVRVQVFELVPCSYESLERGERSELLR